MSPAGGKTVYLVMDDIDRHDPGCDCGLCNSNGKSYGVGIFPAGGNNDDPIERVYAASEESAMHNAKAVCEQSGWTVAEGPAE